MKTERELFLYELEGRGFIFKNKTWIHGLGDVGGLFDDDQLNMVWEMWCASAQREGYKLVTVEKVMDCLYQISDRSYVDDNVSELKAMIGESE